jgi:hypothetical protein
MAKYKSLLVHTEWVIAGKKRKCYHHPSHEISKGDNVLEVAEGMGKKGYCLGCGQTMIAAAVSQLNLMQPISRPI